MRRLLTALLSTAAVLATAGAAAATSPSGPDVASFQHPYGQSIAWGSVAAGGSSFAFVKATEGTGYVNPYYAADSAQAHAADMAVGAYHFARPALPVSTAVDQANYFIAKAGGVSALTTRGELPPVLDLEVTGGLAPAQLLSWAQTWLATVQQATGRAPIVYTYPSFWPNAMANTTALGGYPLWIASYSGSPTVLAGWKTWTFWQYTDKAKLPGVPSSTDVSYFNGTLDQLRALANLPPSPASHNPVGYLDSAALDGGSLQARGWAEDPDSPTSPVTVHVYVDGSVVTATTADQQRTDVAAVLPAGGAAHGYTFTLPAPTAPGPHQVCTYAINIGLGTANPQLGCATVTVPGATAAPGPAPTPTAAPAPPPSPAPAAAAAVPPGHDPAGAYDSLTAAPGLLEARGWAIDPDTTRPVNLHVYIDGVFMARDGAGIARDDLARVYPGSGDAHGFDVQLTASPGAHQVCVYAINMAGPGGNPQLGCRTATVPATPAPGAGAKPAGDSPAGVYDSATAAPGLVDVRGWAIDPDTTGPVNVHVYIDGVFMTRVGAGVARADLARVYPATGSAHGFDVQLTAAAGGHQVCVYAINMAGAGGNPQLGCRTVTVP